MKCGLKHPPAAIILYTEIKLPLCIGAFNMVETCSFHKKGPQQGVEVNSGICYWPKFRIVLLTTFR